MPKSRERDGELTKRRILAVALDLWRRQGPDGVGMREIARAAGVSLGATYHHFASKDAIALALFEEHLARHHELVRAALPSITRIDQRIALALDASLDARAGDRAVLAVLARVVLDPASEASLFHPGTAAIRERSMAIFREVVACDDVPEDARELLAVGLWALHLGVLLRFVLEETPGQPQTRALVRGLGELTGPIVSVLVSPMMGSFRERFVSILRESGVHIGDRDERTSSTGNKRRHGSETIARSRFSGPETDEK